MITKPQEVFDDKQSIILSPTGTIKKEEVNKPKELTEEEKKIKLRKETEERCLMKFSLNWKKMQKISIKNILA